MNKQEIRIIEKTSRNPFTSGAFYKILEDSKCVNNNTGWSTCHFIKKDNSLPGYIKEHSYGEFIFDWAWADFYHSLGLRYYPKLIHMTPFTPIVDSKFIGKKYKNELIKEAFDFYQEKPEISGQHFLFVTQDEENIFKEMKRDIPYYPMHTIQYHWENKWNNFDEFLNSLKPNRKKMIRKERRKIKESGVKFKSYENNFPSHLLEKIYQLYLSTILKKGSHPYLTPTFFKSLDKYLEPNLLVFTAEHESVESDNKIFAMSLFLKSEDCLFGRYWGIDSKLENKFPGLHFEMCYYQGMDYCFQKKISNFQAGAQGEHKLWRGFSPVTIKSYHHLRVPKLFSAIKDHLEKQNFATEQSIAKLRDYLPYRT